MNETRTILILWNKVVYLTYLGGLSLFIKYEMKDNYLFRCVIPELKATYLLEYVVTSEMNGNVGYTCYIVTSDINGNVGVWICRYILSEG